MKTVVVTGATSGIGFAVCKALLKAGFRVLGIGRCEEHCTTALRSLKAENTEYETSFLFGDLLQQAEVRRVAGEIKKSLGEKEPLCALVNNAGAVRSWYMTTNDGHEHQFALNHLAGFLLTHELLPRLLEAHGKVLLTSSNSHRGIKMRWEDIMFQNGYRPLLAYKQSKLCNMLFAFGLNERYRDRGLRAYAVDPGLVRTDIGNKNTGRIIDLFWRLRKTGGVYPEVPAKTYVELCTRENAGSGLYHGIHGEKRYSREVSRENADRLFELSEKLCNIRF